MEKVPIDVFGRVLFYVGKEDLQSVAMVSRAWNRAVIDYTFQINNREARLFVELLRHNLPEQWYNTQKIKLEVKETFNSLKEVELATQIWKKTLVSVLSTLSEEELKGIDKQLKNMPTSLTSIVISARIRQEIEAAHVIIDENEKNQVFKMIVYRLMPILPNPHYEMGVEDVLQAIKVACSITDKGVKIEIMLYIFRILAKRKSIDIAKQMAATIDDVDVKDKIVCYINNELSHHLKWKFVVWRLR